MRGLRSISATVALVWWIAQLSVSPASGQTGSAALGGRVWDQTGAVLPGVALRIVNEGSGASVETASNDAGLFRVGSLLPGRYRIEARLEGFEELVRRGLVLATGQAVAVDLTLSVGAADQVVTVEAAAPLTDSQSATVGQLVNDKMVEGIAMPNRAATALVALAPGVVMIESGQGAENYPLFSVGGGRARNQNFTLDGGNATNATGLTRPQQMTSLPVDAMQEFRVAGNAYSAEHGHSAGGVVTLTTRSGTNEPHGSLFEFLRNSALDGRNFFAREKPPLRLNQFGAALGGPIRRDRTHYFVTWEGTRSTAAETPLETVPSAAFRAGDFSGLRDSRGAPIAIFDPLTTVGTERSPFPDNRIPDSRIDPVARAAFDFWPQPNRAAGASGGNNFSANTDSRLTRNIFVAKVDHQLSDNDKLTGRYYINDAGISNRGAFGIPESDPGANFTDIRVQSVLGGYTRIFSPSVMNDLKVSFLQRKFIDQRFGEGEDLAASLGLTGVSSAAFPTFTLPGFVGLGGSPGRIQTPIRDTQFLESVSWFTGRHAFKFGVEHRRAANNEIRDRASSGSFRFVPQITGLPGAAGTGDALASFALGEVNAADILVSDRIRTRAFYWAGYVQDEWRATDRLTLNLGLRWEAELPRREVDDRQNSFDPDRLNPVSGTPGAVTFSGRDGTPRQAFRTDWNNFGPRVGIAYRLPFQRETVIRTGAGFFYGSTVSNTIGDAASLGFSTSASLVAPEVGLSSALRLRDGFPAFERPPLDDAFGAVALGERPNTAVGFFKPDQVAPISYQYNFNIQREVAADAVLEAGYIGNVSRRLTANDLTLNQAEPGPGDAQARRPFPQFSDVFWINPSIGDSTYHAGYVRLERRFARGYSLLAHYTFSKFIDNVASSVEFGDTVSFMDANNRRLDKGLSGSDVPHRLVLAGLYESPVLRGRPLLDRFLGGWRVGVVTTLQSGAPFTVTTAGDATNAFPAGPVRPNRLRDPGLPGSERTLDRFFDVDAFAPAPPFTFGDSPRSVLRGDAVQAVDLTLSKRFPIAERFHLDLRGEFFNLLNHADFELPGRVLGAGDFGAVLGARRPRTIQVGLRLSF